jgi:gamma-glutamylcyclotransferase (GGCT)/AIG2-like uncharacterized protein YtfP
MLVAVYGSLRKTLSNHRILDDAKYLGNYESEPIFSMFDVGQYPAIKEQGNTSIVLEIYRIDEKILKSLDTLEGYDSEEPDSCYYVRTSIETPFGEAFIYTFPHDTSYYKQVQNGDWTEYITTKEFTNV